MKEVLATFFIGIIFWISVIGILYTYFGYPLLITLFAALKPKPKVFEADLPSVTLLIAAFIIGGLSQKQIPNPGGDRWLVR
jgi:hypothetical protein